MLYYVYVYVLLCYLYYLYYCMNRSMQLLTLYFNGMQIFLTHNFKRNIHVLAKHICILKFSREEQRFSFIAVIHCFDRHGNSQSDRPNHLFANLEKLAKTLLSTWYTVTRRTCFSADSSGFRISRASLQSSYS